MERVNKKLSFGEALRFANAGGLIAREGWNGKRMFVFVRQGATVERRLVKTLPRMVDYYFQEKGIEKLEFTPYLCMKAADDSIVNGWLASQTDLLALDWCVVHPEDYIDRKASDNEK